MTLTQSVSRTARRFGRAPLMARYVIRELTLPLLFFTGVLAGLIWLTQSLDMLDLVLNRGQSAVTFAYLSLLVLPSLITVILPVALFLAVLFAFHRLQSESELAVMWAAGADHTRIVGPVLVVATLVTLTCFVLNLWLMPAGYRTLKDRIQEIRGELATALIREGQFTTPVKGLTIYLGEAGRNGDLINIFAHDNRNPAAPITYMARRGQLQATPEGPRLVLLNGNLQWIEEETGAPRILQYERHSFDLSAYAPGTSQARRELSERYLSELFYPDPDSSWDQRNVGPLMAEGHARLATPLYALAFALIGYVAIACGPFSRRRPPRRLVTATAIVLLLRISGFGAQSLNAELPALFAVQYALPVGAAAAALILIQRERMGLKEGPDLEPARQALSRAGAHAGLVLAPLGRRIAGLWRRDGGER